MRAVILGGTGALGGAVALRLAARGWAVDVTGRSLARMPAELATAGVRFHPTDRSDAHCVDALVGDDADLVFDALAHRAADVLALLPAMRRAGSAVLVSTRAVYVDERGRHLNGAEPPRFDGPVQEDSPTLAPAADDVDPFTREGYAPSKVAAERVALDSGLPVTVLRPSKVHGHWARNARTRPFVERMLRGDAVIPLADLGASVDHLTAAANAAALVEVVAHSPGARVLNVADPDTPDAARIVRAVADHLGWRGRIDLLPPGAPGGEHPWHTVHPVVLDTSESRELGYRPVGTAVDLLADEVAWVAATR